MCNKEEFEEIGVHKRITRRRMTAGEFVGQTLLDCHDCASTFLSYEEALVSEGCDKEYGEVIKSMRSWSIEDES